METPTPNHSVVPLRVLYRDDSLVAIHKPAGHVVHRTPLCPDAPPILQHLRDQLGCFLRPVHRLDRSACGVLVFALTPQAAAALARCFRENALRKDYLAVVRGWTPNSGRIEHSFADKKGGPVREAVTDFRRLAVCELPVPVPPYATARYSLVAVHPESGRTHQIRRHMKHIGHPLIGDTTYGRSEHNLMFRQHLGIHRLLLQAIRLGFTHPETGETLVVEDTLDAEFLTLFARLGWRDFRTSSLDG